MIKNIDIAPDTDCAALLLDLMRCATDYISTRLSRPAFSDDDCDYMPAATSILAAATRAYFLTDLDPDLMRAELLSLLADDDFIADLDCASADLDCDLIRMIDDDFTD